MVPSSTGYYYYFYFFTRDQVSAASLPLACPACKSCGNVDVGLESLSVHMPGWSCAAAPVCMCVHVWETDRKGAAERSVTDFSGCKRGRRARQKPQIKLHTILKETLAEVGEILFKSLSLRVHWHNTCSLKTFNYPLSRAVVSEYKLPLWRNLPCFVKFSSGCPHCSLWPHKISFLQSEALDLSLFVFCLFLQTGGMRMQ